MQEYNKELSSGIACLLSGIVFLLISIFIRFYMIPNTIRQSKSVQNIANDSTLFPKIFAICIGITAIIIIINGIRECIKYKEFLCAKNLKNELVHLLLIDSPGLVVFAILSVIFCIIAPLFGFFASGYIIAVLASYYLGNRGLFWRIIFPAIFIAILWFVFSILLSVSFPAGILF